jgi:hypothetical protein
MKQSSSARKNRYLNEAFEKLKIFLFSKAKRVVSRTSPLMRGGLFCMRYGDTPLLQG